LAHELKKEVNQWCRAHYGIDSLTCTREEKELIREFLVYHGSFKRNFTKGRYWIDKLNDTIVKDKNEGFKVITDIRYDEYDNDEVGWLKNELNGILIHVSMYIDITQVQTSAKGTKVLENKIRKWRSPANTEEAKNDPKIKEKSDFQIEWKFLENGQTDELQPYVDDFIEWLSKEKESLLSTTP
jgi:hypothetical protein